MSADLPDSPVFGVIDPDYARAYSIIRCTAWGYGYAAVMHGSFTRDLDVLLVPWTEQACVSFEHLIKVIAWRTGLEIKGDKPVEKPHGRLAWSLLFPDRDPRWVDISFFPPTKGAA